MTSKEIRESFLSFFESKQHRRVQSAPVVPHGDPTLLFTNAGMNQFKDVFLGTGKRDYSRAADTQKCIRVSGKHNDLEEVGVDTYHHTFFEMLGNWSFGDYYKAEAIEWAWELLTKVWKLAPERLHATVYKTDDESYDLWKKYLPESRIHRFAEKDNFWEMGETGPCGPCSEIHYDRTPDLSGGKLVNAGVPEVIEIWNLVFIQFNRKIDGTLEELSAKHVDTGMGFERICSVIQKVSSNYSTDIFMPIINEIAKLSGHVYTDILTDKSSIAMRVIADHLRTLSFAIADGAMPGNEGRGYVLRRILRRASRFSRNLGFREAILYKLLPVLINVMGDVFPELITNKAVIEKIIKAEEESFLATLDRGLDRIEDIISKLNSVEQTGASVLHQKIISGNDAFLLYDSFGFPLDLTELIARERGIGVDTSGFTKQMEIQKERSRSSRKVHQQEVETGTLEFETVFTGYHEDEHEAMVLYVKENQVVLNYTPFYVESGGQISDTGEIILAGEKYLVTDVRKSGDAIIHFCDRNVEPAIGETVLVKIDLKRRKSIMRNHTATHLLHEALFRTLGSHVKQAGSLVSPDYLRFDFNHFEKVSNDEIKKIESIVNDKILEGIDVETRVMRIEDAQKSSKAKMFFGDKYGDIVRVVVVDEKYSMEFCGGTHVKNSSDIGLFKIISESSIAAGVRRIEAITGKAIENYIDSLNQKIADKDKYASDLHEKIRLLEKDITDIKNAELKKGMSDIIQKAELVNDIRVLIQQIQVENLDQLRTAGENLRNTFGTKGIGLLAAIIEDKVQLVCIVTDDLVKKYPAGKLVGEAAKILGGGGGGKPHLATAGGKDLEKLPELLTEFRNIVSKYGF